LKEKGVKENTLIIFTSDHGEFLGEKYLGKRRIGHNQPIRKELNIVPTVFVNYEVDWSHMRTIDIIPTALSIVGKEFESDGKDLTSNEPPRKGYTMLDIMARPKIATGCNWHYKNSWDLGPGKYWIDIATLGKAGLKPLKKKIKEIESSENGEKENDDISGPVAHVDV
jgi:arylsulfatase A-like enzyme